MYIVYLLISQGNHKKSYIGKTIKPVKVRLSEHNKGLSRFTKSFVPWQLIYYETFYCALCADKREQFLKSGIGFRLRKILLENYDKVR